MKPGFLVNNVHLINQDSYFRKENDPNHQKIEELNHFNWDIIESMDMVLMLQDIFQILGSDYILNKTKSSSFHLKRDNIFWDHYRSNANNSLSPTTFKDFNCEHGILNKVAKPNKLLNILIIEGFLIFSHTILLDLFNIKFHLHVPYEICYERRKKRQYEPPDVPLYFEMVVWPYYERHLREFKHREEIIFLNGDTLPDKCFEYVKRRIWNDVV